MVRRFLFVLAAVLASCAGTGTPVFAQAAPAADSALPQLPPLPAYLWSPNGLVPVLRANPVPCGPIIGALACFHAESGVRTITVSDTLAPLMAWFALEHERVHLQFLDEGVDFASSEMEDAVASAIARQRVKAMVAYLRAVEREQGVRQAGAPSP